MDYPTARVRYFIKLAQKQGRWIAKCEACDDKPATEIHHMRGRTGDLLTDPRFFLGVCPGCHRKITVNPGWALDMGYSSSRMGLIDGRPESVQLSA